MSDWLQYETLIRTSVFAGVFLLMAALETLFPRKARVKGRPMRWFTNFSMVVIANLIMRVAIPLAAIGVAALMQERGFGLFNLTDWPIGLEILLAVIILDFAIWFQHLFMHYVPVLWALHKVHHADEDLDASSGIRFHPIEQVFSLGLKMAVVALIGADPLAVFIFEVLLNATAMFNHASINIPQPVDRVLRKIMVTPDFHRVHHSIYEPETNSNFGFNLSIWDQIFRTYTPQPRDGHENMQLGLDKRPDGNTAGLLWGLVLPFRRD